MKIIYQLFFLLLLMSCSFYSFGQNYSYLKQHGKTYKRNTIAWQLEEDRYKQIKFATIDTTFFLYPSEVEGYQTKDGTYYQTFKILIDKEPTDYFLKMEGDTEYGRVFTCIDPEFRERIFLETADELIEFSDNPKDENFYGKIFTHVRKKRCRVRKKIIAFTRFSGESIRRSLSALANCEIKFTPQKAIYLSYGNGFQRLSFPQTENEFFLIPRSSFKNQEDFSNRSSSFIEVGYLIPINRSTTSFFPSIRYSFHNSSFRREDGSNLFILEYEVNTIEFSPLFKVNFPRDKWQISLYLGPTLGLPTTTSVEIVRDLFVGFNESRAVTIQTGNDIGVQIGYTAKVALEHQLGDRFGVGTFVSLNQFKQTGGDNPKFNGTNLNFGLSLFFK